jgi:hypothetical protein
MSSSINRTGAFALSAFALSLIPSWLSLISGLSAIILTTVLYAKIDKLGHGTNLFNLSLRQWGISLFPTAILVYFSYKQLHNHHWVILFFLVILSLLVFLAIINYFIAQSLLSLSIKLHNKWFYYSGLLTKFAAYTMPLFIGFFLLILAQPVFLIGCIFYQEGQLNPGGNSLRSS